MKRPHQGKVCDFPESYSRRLIYYHHSFQGRSFPSVPKEWPFGYLPPCQMILRGQLPFPVSHENKSNICEWTRKKIRRSKNVHRNGKSSIQIYMINRSLSRRLQKYNADTICTKALGKLMLWSLSCCGRGVISSNFRGGLGLILGTRNFPNAHPPILLVVECLFQISGAMWCRSAKSFSDTRSKFGVHVDFWVCSIAYEKLGYICSVLEHGYTVTPRYGSTFRIFAGLH